MFGTIEGATPSTVYWIVTWNSDLWNNKTSAPRALDQVMTLQSAGRLPWPSKGSQRRPRWTKKNNWQGWIRMTVSQICKASFWALGGFLKDVAFMYCDYSTLWKQECKDTYAPFISLYIPLCDIPYLHVSHGSCRRCRHYQLHHHIFCSLYILIRIIRIITIANRRRFPIENEIISLYTLAKPTGDLAHSQHGGLRCWTLELARHPASLSFDLWAMPTLPRHGCFPMLDRPWKTSIF